jgi:hypothetical protein
MAENRAIVVANISHLRDLEEHQKQRRNEIADLSEEEEKHREMKEAEIMYLVKEKENFNKKIEAKKDKIGNEIVNIDVKINCLVEALEGLNQKTDIENVVSPAEDMEEERPQGLKTVV